MQKYGDRVALHVESTLLRMHYCRTAALGKHVHRCDSCNEESTTFNSCGDRHCPQCSGAKRRNWLDRTLQLTIPEATYFQVVFTLPDKLSSLALGNRRAIYELLVATAWASLRGKVESELGIQTAAVAVLHTWNQHLGHHPHVHMMVPGSGPSLDGKRWVGCRQEWSRKRKQMEPFLVDNKELGAEFQRLFLDGLSKLVEQGKLKLVESGWIADLIDELRLQPWVVFIEGPPKPDTPPSQMIKYLTRYLTGGPISDGRIVSEKDGRIYFKARSKKKDGGQTIASLSAVEFVQQWSLHILPKQFTKVRQYGAWSGSKRRRYLEQCRVLAEQAEKEPSRSATTNSSTSSKKPEAPTKKERSCPHCGRAMRCVVAERRPSWRELFYGPDHPSWFEWTSRGMCVPPDEVTTHGSG